MERLRTLAAKVAPLLAIMVGLAFAPASEIAWAASDSKASGGNVPLSVKSLDDDDDERQITLRLVEDLSFGKIVAGGRRGGAVVINAATGRRTVSGGAIQLGGRYGRAEFVVRGTPNTRFRIFYPGKIEMRGQNGRARLIDINSVPGRVGTIGRNGEAIIFVGATLELRSSQPSGRYRGTFSIRADSDDD